MPTPGGYPFPDPTQKVAQLDLALKALAERADPMVCLRTRTTTVSVANGGWADVPMTATNHDPWGIASAGGILVPVGAGGPWQFFGQVGFAVSAAGTSRGVRFVVNGATDLGAQQLVDPIDGTHGVNVQCSVIAVLNPGDLVSLQAYQNSGAAMTLPASLPARLSARRL